MADIELPQREQDAEDDREQAEWVRQHARSLVPLAHEATQTNKSSGPERGGALRTADELAAAVQRGGGREIARRHLLPAFARYMPFANAGRIGSLPNRNFAVCPELRQTGVPSFCIWDASGVLPYEAHER
jgi:hypothetical protein